MLKFIKYYCYNLKNKPMTDNFTTEITHILYGRNNINTKTGTFISLFDHITNINRARNGSW